MDAAAFNRRLGQLLRATRMAYGFSLADVEGRSGGRLIGGTVCSYERGVRAVDAERLVELAAFYGVPAVELIPV